LVTIAVGVEVVAQAASPAAEWKTSTAPFDELTPGAPRKASVPSLERATDSPRMSFAPLFAFDRIAVGVVLDAQELSDETW
jgi:hypothetical protein